MKICFRVAHTIEFMAVCWYLQKYNLCVLRILLNKAA